MDGYKQYGNKKLVYWIVKDDCRSVWDKENYPDKQTAEGVMQFDNLQGYHIESRLMRI